MAAIGVWLFGKTGFLRMPVAKRVKSRVAPPERVAVGAPPGAVVVVPPEPSPRTRIIELKITMLPHAAAPSVAHWRSFEASIARVANRGSMAPRCESIMTYAEQPFRLTVGTPPRRSGW